MIHVPRYFEGLKKNSVKPPPLSSGRPPTTVQNPAPPPPTLAPFDKESDNIGGHITVEFSNPSNLANCEPVIGIASSYPRKVEEDFLVKIKEIDKDIKIFDLSEKDVIKPTSAIPSTNGPTLKPTEPILSPLDGHGLLSLPTPKRIDGVEKHR